MRVAVRPALVWLAAALPLAALPYPGQAQTTDHTYTSEAIQAGARVYVAECALCHGSTGDGVDGVDLRRGLSRSGRSDDDLRQIITGGVSGSRMPAFDLQDSELESVVAYMRAGFDPSGVAVRVGDAARGQAIFEGEGRCTRCHRVNGQGGGRLAPDLGEVGIRRAPSALQQKLLDPSGSLLPINRPVRIVTAGGEEVRGRRLNEDTYSVQLVDREGRLRSLLKRDLAEFEVSQTATMRPTSLSAEQVADVVGYLLTLTGLE